MGFFQREPDDDDACLERSPVAWLRVFTQPQKRPTTRRQSSSAAARVETVRQTLVSTLRKESGTSRSNDVVNVKMFVIHMIFITVVS